MNDAEHYRALIEQAQELRHRSLSLADAVRIGTAAAARAAQAGLPIVVGVQLGPLRAFQQALPGSSANNAAWVDRKIRTVLHFELSSFAVGALYRSQGKTFATQSGLDPALYSDYGGAVPLFSADLVVGALGISGLPQAEDHALAVEVLRADLLRLGTER